MQKAEEHKVEDSNVENIGSAEDKAARKAAAESEPEWKGAGEAVGLEIWRVENKRTENDTPDFGVKRWPKEQCGSFYKGDSYIIMRTYQLPDDEKILFDLHFWIGEESSQDEYGVAAYKTVELDDLLDGRPVQHRETMGHESELFMSYFPDGLMIMSGGIESGFRKVTAEEYKPRLLQIQRTGKQVKTFEIDECTVGSLNNGDCFILDAGAKIFVFHGSESDAFEKNHATSTGEKMESERGDGAERVEVDETFWEILGGSEADVSSDSTVAKPGEFTGPSLYSLDDDTQEWSKVKDGLIAPDEIKTDDVMMIDCGAEIFVMVGEEAPAKEKNDCMIKAQQYLKANNKPVFTPITRVKEGQNPNNESYDKCMAAAEPEPESEPEPEPEPEPEEPVEEADPPTSAPEPAPAAAEPAPGTGETFSLEALKGGCPKGVDAKRKEEFLHADEFEGALGMSKEDFDKLAKWKKDAAKKKAGIF